MNVPPQRPGAYQFCCRYQELGAVLPLSAMPEGLQVQDDDEETSKVRVQPGTGL